MLRSGPMAVAVAVVALAACAAPDDPVAAPPSTVAAARATTSTTEPVDPVAAWASQAGTLSSATVVSDVVVDGDERFAVSVSAAGAVVWRFAHGAWGLSSTVELALPAGGPDGGRVVVEAVDLTGDGVGDVLVPQVGVGVFATVVSNHSGRWAAVPFAARTGTTTTVEDLGIQGGDAVSYDRLCVPDCATGAIDEITWAYDAVTATFVELGRFEVVAAVPPPMPPSPTPAVTPGGPCLLGSSPDCIDPDGDGQGTFLIGGADCIASLGAESGLCTDLDGDGMAGYPDRG